MSRLCNQQLRTANSSTKDPDPGPNPNLNRSDLANVALLDGIEYMFNATCKLKDYSVAPNISNKPCTLAEAK